MAASLGKGGFTAAHRRTQGGLNSKLHALCDASGQPVRLLLATWNVNDIVGAGESLKDLQDSGEPKKSGSSPRHIGRTKGGFGSKLNRKHVP
ncbi:MAG: hypothetical protein LBF42_02060 [Puniceicoccales bacterium]|jgi:hypothetical protein|nr:hypothetical protein [Puniceicoccales bacterium]